MYTKMGRKEKGFLSTIAVCDILVLFLILANILSKERTGISLAWNMILAGSVLGVQAGGGTVYFSGTTNAPEFVGTVVACGDGAL